jgi:sugar phosphate isomerase/epimerase
VAWVVEGILRVAEAATRVGLRVNVENHTKAFTWTYFDFAMQGEIFVRVMEGLRDVPVGVQFDIANPLVAGEDPLALLEKVRPRVGYVHVNDVRRPGVFEFVTVGTGIAPVREVLRRLREQGYAGWVGIEEASRTGKDGFRQAVQYTRQVLS